MKFERKVARAAFKKQVKDLKKKGQLRKDVPTAYLWATYQNMERNYAKMQTAVEKFGISEQAATLENASTTDELMKSIDDILSVAIEKAQPKEENEGTEPAPLD